MNGQENINFFEKESTYWWYHVLDDMVEYYVSVYDSPISLKILDAGCGTGRMLAALSKYGDVYGIDNSPIAIEMCKSKGLSNVDIPDLNTWSAENKFNIVVSLDVLYHKSINGIDKIINSFNNALYPNGILILNLPAFDILSRGHDDIVGGNRRFRLKEIKNILIKNGFQIHAISYHNPILFIVILLRKLLSSSKKEKKSDSAPIYPPLNQIFSFLHKIENEIIKIGFSFPFGSSLFVVAKKNDSCNNPAHHSQAYSNSNFLSKLKVYGGSKTLMGQFFKYSIVGVFNTMIGLSVIYLLHNVFHFNYIISNIGGYFFGLLNAFIWNKKWTFKSSQHYSKEIIPFLIVFGISYVANLLTVIFSVEFLKIRPNVAQIIGIVVYSSTNFLVNRFWTFSKAK
jgi:putative flippase GtrA/SAM-dependent methyltransferase